MEDSESRTITFKVSGEEAESIDSSARTAGLSRSDYIRQRLLNLSRAPQPTPEPISLSKDPIALLHQVLYGLQRIIAAQYRIPFMAGTLPAEQLEIAGAHTIQKATAYLSNLEAGLAKTRKQVADYLVAQDQLSAAKAE
jgi:hypothetical protein